jgi:hypothetical protein
MNEDYFEDDDTAEHEALRRPRRRLGVVLLSVGVAVVLIGCGVIATLAKGVDRKPAANGAKDAGTITVAASTAPSPTETPAAPVVASSAPPSRSPSPTKKPKATETVQAPAPRRSTPPGCEPSRGPNQLSKAKVKEYLDKAARTQFWGTATKPEYADIRVPTRLLYAIAEQESGWQSDIKACDGGLGLMQIMPNTQTFVNNRFGTSRDRAKASDNVMLGANYLAWLIAYYGDKVGGYDTSNPDLLKAVISAYNWGTVGVEPGMSPYPNGVYVQNVLYLMQQSRAGNY